MIDDDSCPFCNTGDLDGRPGFEDGEGEYEYECRQCGEFYLVEVTAEVMFSYCTSKIEECASCKDGLDDPAYEDWNGEETIKCVVCGELHNITAWLEYFNKKINEDEDFYLKKIAELRSAEILKTQRRSK